MFELRLLSDKEKLDVISIRCINFKRETSLYLKDTTFDEMITKFVLNKILHHVGMSWIISTNKEMEYEINKTNHQDWLNKGHWYTTSICLKLHVGMFKTIIKHERIDRYNIMCSLVAHDKIQPAYKDDKSSIGDRSIPKNATTKALKALGDTLIFIDKWLTLFDKNYDARCEPHITDMKEMFKQIPQTMSKPITPKQNIQKLMTYGGGRWYMEFFLWHYFY